MIDGINQLPAPLPILPKGHYVWEWLCQAMPSNAHDFIYFLRPEVLTGASNLGGIKLSTTNQYLLLTIISYYKLLLTIINYYYLLLTIINHYITIRWLVGQPPATLPFLRFFVSPFTFASLASLGARGMAPPSPSVKTGLGQSAMQVLAPWMPWMPWPWPWWWWENSMGKIHGKSPGKSRIPWEVLINGNYPVVAVS